jgi:isocitrate lyase
MTATQTQLTFEQLIPSAPQGRYQGIQRNYTPEDVFRLRGSIPIRYTLAEMGANRLWELLHTEDYINSLGAMTGNQAMQMVRAGLKAIYLSGWQVAADSNVAGAMYPDQSLYPANSGPELCRRINRTFQRADQIHHAEGKNGVHWFAPIVADAEAGFGGPLNSFEIMKAYIEAGAAAVHFEDQLAAEKKCGHLGGKVLIPTAAQIRNLNAARLAADTMGVPTLVVARTDAESAKLITSDVDDRDLPFITGERTVEGFYRLKPGSGLAHCIARGLAYAPYADLLWWETSTPNLEEARQFAEAIHSKYPGKLLAYNCSPSFNWKANLDETTIAKFQKELGAMGYKFQFVTLAGFHSLNYSMFELARGYAQSGMAAYSELQEAEFASEAHGYSATRHQREVGTGYFDAVSMAISGGQSSTTALANSTEAKQFQPVDEYKTTHATIDYSNGHETVHAEVDSAIYHCVREVKALADVDETEFINQVYRCVQHVKASDNFHEEHYARIKDAYREIEEFARVDDE